MPRRKPKMHTRLSKRIFSELQSIRRNRLKPAICRNKNNLIEILITIRNRLRCLPHRRSMMVTRRFKLLNMKLKYMRKNFLSKSKRKKPTMRRIFVRQNWISIFRRRRWS
jgi:hypothetical protein